MSGRGVAGLFLFFACLYALSLGRGFYSSDGEVMFQTTAALVERGTFALPPDPNLPQIVPGRGGRWYGKYGAGFPVLLVPFYMAGNALAAVNAAHRTHTAALSVLVASALLAAGAAAGVGALSGSRWAAIAAGLATPLWWYGRVLFAEAALACALSWALWALRRRHAWLAGALIGMGVAARGGFAVYGLAAWGLAWGAHAEVRERPPAGARRPPRKRGAKRQSRFGCAVRRTAARPLRALRARARPAGGHPARAFLTGLLPFLALALAFNAYRFGAPWRTGYAGEGFTTPLWRGVGGLLLSPQRSVFLFAPPLALSVALWPRYLRRDPLMARFLALAWTLALPFYGAWWAWGGGWCWGPRFLVPLLPLSMLPLSTLPPHRAWRTLAAALIALGALVNMAGVLVDVTPYFTRGGLSPVLYAAERLWWGQTEPLAFFHLRTLGLPPTWDVGLPALLLLGLATGTWLLAYNAVEHIRKGE